MRDSAGISPDFASNTTHGRTVRCRAYQGRLRRGARYASPMKPVINLAVLAAAAVVAAVLVASRRERRPAPEAGTWEPAEDGG